MIYPKNFEQKIGFSEIRELLNARCLTALGKACVARITFSTDAELINSQMEQTRELRRIRQGEDGLPLGAFFDIRESMKRLRVTGTYLEEEELFDLQRTLQTIHALVKFLKSGEEAADGRTVYDYPALAELTDGVIPMPTVIQRIMQVLDKFGHIRDNASPELADIRRELARTQNSISGILNNILLSAQKDGLVDKDVAPTLRDGRLVLPVAPGLKRKIRGIVHDESASGRTVYIEPAEVVEANNRIRELKSDERHEVVRILREVADFVRPHSEEILFSLEFLAQVDFLQAKADLAESMRAMEPEVEDHPHIDWIRAEHPLLKRTLEKHGDKPLVPLDILLTAEKHILIISGPNAGGKSVCLKTVGLLQYMLQCGLSIPVGDRSKTGVFEDIMIDIGDEQSLENDLSTYSSHLLNMKNMMKQAGKETLILIDEFGTGTEPAIGGAIAEAVLDRLMRDGAWGVITTHYQNLKHFADNHEGVANGAMLYDRGEMRPLFQLAIGRPGSSFAIEIARKIGLPEEVIHEASEIVGADYIQSDKYLQDIVRDKRYWENKRQNIHQREKDLEQRIAHYETDITNINQERKEILRKAKQQAEELLSETNRKIENTIREIRENQAHKEETRRIREELEQFKQDVAEIDTRENDDKIARKIAQIQQRKERKAQRKAEKAEREEKAAESLRRTARKAAEADSSAPLKEGDSVRIKGTKSVGTLESMDGKMGTAIFGGMKTRLRLDRLERAEGSSAQESEAPSKTKADELKESLQAFHISHITQNTIDDHRRNFRQDLDIRGMRGDEALNAVQYFIDDAILAGMPRVRILHGKGNGILRQLIRQYLATVPNVTHFADEHVQFGGAGITVVDM
ncbi:endonuclease MutS2 [Prevotella sp. KH2C16]|uniref:endonuclease MutS2 n=1 Tax=Prevotella sp. KH2C16 TaxID=1855325 RepID=UPI0008EB296A|nr:Smr/MutS family protein [Prevotella sp. KH2C16]SFG15294.1 DNA mismatch repair protein MutS2 [Prevotella sp. KH2C16]